jgi:hypothetical protein
LRGSLDEGEETPSVVLEEEGNSLPVVCIEHLPHEMEVLFLLVLKVLETLDVDHSGESI